MSCPFLPDFLEPRLLVPCFFGVASLSVDAADDDDVAGDADEDGASDDASESCTGAARADAARADAARKGCTREGCTRERCAEADVGSCGVERFKCGVLLLIYRQRKKSERWSGPKLASIGFW